MIRIGLFSVDSTLQSHLVSSLGRDFEIHAAGTEDKALALIDTAACDVLLIDLPSDSLFLKKRLEIAGRLIKSSVSAVVLADSALQSAALELISRGAFGECRRPVATRDLRTMLERANDATLAMRELQAQHRKTDSATNSDRLIGSSAAIRQVYHLVHRVANLNATVLINGESGTGKELIARAIHKLGSRSNKPFVAVSCGAIPETLIEAELFGHEKGAFTGTVGAREGYFEQAADGTLFLDEIGDLSLYTQVKLLRVLQQMEFSRLGSTRLIPLRARLIFATHQDLAKLVEEGKFRQDLYYRINVMRIVSPALADHAEDIPQIATHYLKHYSNLFAKEMESISPEAMAMLQSYAWPGNVRELENTIQRAIILTPGTVVRPEDLPLHLHGDKIVEISDYNPEGSFDRLLRDYKVKLAVDAVRDNNGNRTLAARALGISRAYLHRLVRLAGSDVAEESEPARNSDDDSASA
jgi:DNA-binding NtrC family response regulator